MKPNPTTLAALALAGAVALSPVVALPAQAASPVILSEIESNGGTPGDWIELQNTSTAAIDVSGWQLIDGDATHARYTLPAGTTIPAGGFLVVEEAQFSWGLGGADTVTLYDASGAQADSYTWAAHATTTYGLCSGSFTTTVSSTKGAANDCPVPVKVVLSEVESNGGTPGDWVELHNAGTAPVDLGGWQVIDADTTHVRYTIPAGTVLPVGGYYTVEEAQLGFGLGGADSVTLYNPAGAVADTYSWTAHAATSYGLCAGRWVATGATTKAAANDCSVPVRINEVASSGTDFIELINTSAQTVDISGIVLKDNADTSAWQPPAGTTIPAGGYYLVDTLPFGLGSADSARLYGGTQLLDSYTWAAHGVPSWARCPDGTGDFAAPYAATPGAANQCEAPTTPAGTVLINEVESLRRHAR